MQRLPQVLVQGGVLGACQALLTILSPIELPLVGAVLVGWAALMWSTQAWDRRDVHWPSLVMVTVVASVPMVAASVWVGAAWLTALAASAVGVGLSRLELVPAFPDTLSPEDWARANRSKYQGRGTGRPIDTLSHDPYGGILGSSPVPEPTPDPYDEGDVRYHEHVDDDGRPR